MSDPSVTIVALELARQPKVVGTFQPAQLVVDKLVPWQPQPVSAASDMPGLKFTVAIGRTMSIRLALDGVKTATSVQPALDQLQRMTRAINASGSGDLKRPPRVAVRFPADKIPEFSGVIEHLSFSYAQLLDDGTPVLASVDLRVREAGNLMVGHP